MLSPECQMLDSLERLLNILQRVAQYDGTAVRTGDGEIGFRQLGEEPLHLVLLQRHVDLNGSMASDGCRDSRAHRLEVGTLIFPRQLLKQFVQHVLDLGSVDASGRNLYGDTAGAERFRFETIMREFI